MIQKKLRKQQRCDQRAKKISDSTRRLSGPLIDPLSPVCTFVCFAAWCSVVQCLAVSCSVLQCLAMCLLLLVTRCTSPLCHPTPYCSSRCVTACCSLFALPHLCVCAQTEDALCRTHECVMSLQHTTILQHFALQCVTV